MEFVGIDLQRISLGALIIALALLVDDAMTTIDVDDVAARRRATTRSRRRPSPTRTLAVPDADRHARHHRRLRADRLRASSAGEYTFSIFAVVGIALIVSWFVAVIFAPLLGVGILKKPDGDRRRRARPASCARFRGLPASARCGRAGSRSRVTLACFVAAVLALPLVPRQFFPASDRPELLVDLQPAAERLDLRQRGRRRAARRGPRRTIPTSRAGAPMSGAARSASTCRSTCSCRTTSSPRPWSSPRTSTARERLQAKLETVLAEQFPSACRACRRSSSGRRSAGRCSTASAGPTSRRCATSRCELAQAIAAEPARRARQFRLDRAGARRCASTSTRTRRGCSG